MTELKAGVIKTPHDEGMSFNRDSDHVAVTEGETEFYLKSEVDGEIARLNKKLDIYKRGFKEDDRINVFLCKSVRHQKYKRCFAMANWCFMKSNYHYLVGRAEGGRFAKDSFRRSDLYLKWCDRWQRLAEQFKEDK